MTEPAVVHVGGEQPYDVVIGTGTLGRLPNLLGDGARRVAVVSSSSVARIAAAVAGQISNLGLEVLDIEVPDGEAAKDIDVATRAWNALARAEFTRTDVVVGVGGGTVTDVAGFVAAAWLRGVRLITVPTTLAGMVDAAVGGKTGVNIPAGKNLVGAFHPPAGVVCDTEALATLPRRDYVAGMAEVVKAGFIADPRILALVESDLSAATDPAGPHTLELIVRSVSVKAAVVSGDLREQGTGGGIGREVLNYGHTLGHAIEQVEGYRWRHGDAVAVGMVFVAELARRAGLLDDVTADRHRAILSVLGLPTGYRGGEWSRLRDVMRIDKKSRGDRLRFVVLEGLARPTILDNPEPALLEAAFAEVSA